MEYECEENDCLIEMGRDKSEILISVQGETAKTVIGLKDINQALIFFGVSNQRELLIAYELKMRSCSDKQAETMVDSYIASTSN